MTGDEDSSDLCQWAFYLTFLIALVVLGIPAALVLLLSLSHHSIFILRNMRNLFLETKDPSVYFSFIASQLFLGFMDLTVAVTLPLLSAWVILLTLYRLPIVIKKLWNDYPHQSASQVMDLGSSYYLIGVVWEILLDILALLFLFIPILVTLHRLPTLLARLKACNSYEGMVDNWAGYCGEEFMMIGSCFPNYLTCGAWGGAILGLIGAFLFLPFALFSLVCAVITLLTFSHRALILIRFLHLNTDWSPLNVASSLAFSAAWILVDLVVFATLPLIAW